MWKVGTTQLVLGWYSDGGQLPPALSHACLLEGPPKNA